MAHATRLAARYLSPLLLLVPGCTEGAPSADSTTVQGVSIPEESEAIGTLQLQSSAMFKQAKYCPSGVQCVSADIDDDDRNDIVRLDESGALGTPGGVWVARGDGWGFGNSRLMGWCEPKDDCTLGDVDGDGRPELIGFRPYAGEAYYVRLRDDAKGELIQFGKGLCWEGSHCQVADLNRDGRADVVELNDNGLRVFDNLAKGGLGKPRILGGGVCKEATCRLGDIDGDRIPDLVRLPKDDQGAVDFVHLDEKRFGTATPWLDGACSDGRCDLADVLGTGTLQLLSVEGKYLRLFGYRAKGESLELTLKLPISCGTGERCWWSDATADGRADFWRQTLKGNLLIYPMRDLVGTLQATVLDYTLLTQRYGQGVNKEFETALFESIHTDLDFPKEWDEQFGPERFSWPADVVRMSDAAYASDSMRLINRANGSVASLLGRLPSESALTDGIEQRRWQRAMGQIVAARTALLSDALGATRRAGVGRCGNVVVHDHYLLDDGEHISPGYLARYYDAFREPDQRLRVSQASAALTAIWEGFRCLSQAELNSLELAYVEALTTTLADLQDRAHPVLARRMWDRSLPLTLLFFEAVQHHTVPQTWRLLQLRFDRGVPLLPDLPPRGFDFAAAAADAACETLWCELYRSSARSLPENRVLTLDEIGVWLPNLGDNRLERFEAFAERLMPGLIDLRRLGEGDCMLGEVLRFGMRCPSERTCDAPSAALATYPGMSVDPAPGVLGSDLTHLMTDRTSLPTHNGCDGGSSGSSPAAPLAGCGGPPMRTRAGAFSPDPMMDRMFRCALASTHVDMDFELSADCLVVQGDPSSGGSGGTSGAGGAGGSGGTGGSSGPGGTAGTGGTGSAGSGPDPSDDLEKPSTKIEMLRLFTGAGSVNGRTSYDFALAMVKAIRNRGIGPVPTVGQVMDQMRASASDYFGPGATRLYADPKAHLRGGIPHVGGTNGDNDIIYNPNLMGEAAAEFNDKFGGTTHDFVTTFLSHEFVHVVMNEMAGAGIISKVWLNDSRSVHDTITRPLLGRSCGIDQDCSSSCGLGDAIARRFASCVEGDPGTLSEDVRCRFAQDYCDGRGHGDMGGYVTGTGCTGSPNVSVNSECFAVNCADPGSVTSACCGAISGGLPPSVFFIPRVDPGPMPPRPGLIIDGLPWADGYPLP